MKTFALSITLLFFYVHASAQGAWKEYYNSDGIKISLQDASCTAEQANLTYKFIKVENQSTHRAKISYQLEIYYQHGCNGCNGSAENAASFMLEPGTQVEGSCDYNLPIRLDILVGNSNLPAMQFTHFNIKDITVQWIE